MTMSVIDAVFSISESCCKLSSVLTSLLDILPIHQTVLLHIVTKEFLISNFLVTSTRQSISPVEKQRSMSALRLRKHYFSILKDVFNKPYQQGKLRVIIKKHFKYLIENLRNLTAIRNH